VVTKVAERNPQKLRQIGLNYDIANAKGASELTEEEKQKKEQKQREAAEKKKKKEEAEAKEKEAFEEWKKEERAEYEAWKKEKAKTKHKEEEAKTGKKDGEAKERITKTAAVDSEQPTATAQIDDAKDADRSSTNVPTVKIETTHDTSDAKKTQPTVEGKVKSEKQDASDDGEPQHTPEEDTAPGDRIRTAASSVMDGPVPYRLLYSRHPESVYGDVPPPPPAKANGGESDSTPKPWNAVCVLGLRVYSQDPKVSIKLIKPRNEEEGAILDVGDVAAGATM
jgi:hypothetical protein